MSIKPGKIKITEKIDDYNFFKFTYNHIEYYAINLYFSDMREGYLIFYLPGQLSFLFKETEYNPIAMKELFNDKVDRFYFASFGDEDPESGYIEYVAEIDKVDVLNIFKTF